VMMKKSSGSGRSARCTRPWARGRTGRLTED
jgi:hypothetical protein